MRISISVFLSCIISLISLPLLSQPLDNELIQSRSTTIKRIDVGGFELNFRVTDGELPAIVFESGGGLDSLEWRAIQEIVRINLRNAAVSYDRSGMGQSDLSPVSYSLDSEVRALNSGLETLGYADSIIYVGHSYGAFLLDAYANKYSDSIEGLLYIEPNNIDYVTATGGPKIALESFDPDNVPDNNYGKAMAKQILASKEVYDRINSIQDITAPCLIITAGIRWMENDKLNDKWRESHQSIADRCGTELIIAEGDNHAVPFLSPHLVVDSILELLPH